MAKAKRRIGPFEIERKLGDGGMGVVYLAKYLKDNRMVALKVLTPTMSSDMKLRARFNREMEILKKLRHKHIVRYFGGGTVDGQTFYAMEYIDGGSVEDLLEKRGRLGWEQVIEFTRAICKGLEYAHEAGIVHRDLKPANLFLTKKGQLKIGDFGIAQDTNATALTAPGSTVGTYAYMAPEQITGKKPISRKTDLYALGCVMYEMLTLRTPYEHDSMPAMLMAHLKEEPERLTSFAIDCPYWLESLIEKLMAKDPEDRYFDALAVQVALDDVGQRVAARTAVSGATKDGRTAIAPGSPTVETKGRKKRKKKKKAAGPIYERTWFLVMCLAALIGFVTWSVWPMSEQRLYEEAKTLMASKNIDDWRTAREKFIEPLQERFPNSQYNPEVREWLDRIEMDLALRQSTSRKERGVKPKSVAEAQFMEAQDFEDFGDLAFADSKYAQLIESIRGNEDARPFRLLAEKQRAQIADRQSDPPITSVEFVNQQLREAEGLFLDDQLLGAQKIWRRINSLYRDNPTYQKQVEHSVSRLAGKKVQPLEEVLREDTSDNDE
ncbi:serine/threonine protein kinase [Thalassoroseus pseudoceratinae]|uniref:serine/threonine protein kinase n=1 Tax=Thalassoroseus pseudoceratinae TaxID=2713176 RepID=UPI0014207A82|nr:serine/threonine-protein kinase [Thalassoroseus pseudoceratinae]